MEITVCQRTVCDVVLNKGHYQIFNNNSDAGRKYCIKCGRKIIEINPPLKYKVFGATGELIREFDGETLHNYNQAKP